MAQELIQLDNGKLVLHFHPGQLRAWESKKRFVLVLAGTQGGKTSFGPHWLYREIQLRGPGDYLVATPDFQILEKKALPEFRRVFERILRVGRYIGSPSRIFRFSTDGEERTFGASVRADVPTQIYFGHAATPESLEAMTAKAAWLDEAGQSMFRLGSYEAVLRRLAINEGRVLISTTPYGLGWLKQRLFDPWEAAGRQHPLIDVVRFDSTENPAFPVAEFERAKAELPAWKFNLFYRGIFTRPAGMVYDCFNEEECRVKRFSIPFSWPRYLGLDFGAVNTAGAFYAQEPGGRLYLYREYRAGGRTSKEHVRALLEGEPTCPNGKVSIPFAVGGSLTEEGWREAFRAAGLPIREPDQGDVEVGIQRVYGAHKRNEIVVFSDLTHYLDEKLSYSREVDPMGNVLEKIENKSDFHMMDAERYIIGWLKRPSVAGSPAAGGSRPATATRETRPQAGGSPFGGGGAQRPWTPR